MPLIVLKWDGFACLKPGLTTPLDLFCPESIQSRDNSAIGLIDICVSVFCSCAHVFFFWILCALVAFVSQYTHFSYSLIPLLGINSALEVIVLIRLIASLVYILTTFVLRHHDCHIHHLHF